LNNYPATVCTLLLNIQISQAIDLTGNAYRSCDKNLMAHFLEHLVHIYYLHMLRSGPEGCLHNDIVNKAKKYRKTNR